ncbi:MAG: AAA family ATPase [Burkholderiales bacterium]|nr:AAA family ATPase [Burkholderiales bacterium]
MLALTGKPSLKRAGQADVGLEIKDAVLLAVLALDGSQPRERLAAWLWPDVPAERARANLRQRLFRLKKACGIDLVTGGATLVLGEGVVVDVHRPIGHAHGAEPQRFAELLAGFDIDGCPELDRWLHTARERLRNRWRQAIEALADAAERGHDWTAARRLAQTLLEADRLAESAHRRLMRLHHVCGDRAAALAAYERCEQLLRAELGVAPGEETQALRRLVEAGRPPRGNASMSAALLRPPLLVGRDGVWQHLLRAHARRGTVLISGEAGIGKSRLIGEFVAAAGHAVSVGARPGDEHQPYVVLARLLRAALAHHGAMPVGENEDASVRAELARLLPELGTAPDGALAPVRLAWAVEATLRGCASRGLALLAVDDLHFADHASLALLLPLAGQGADAAPGACATWLLASRTGEMPASLRQWEAEITHLPLEPLDVQDVRALIASLELPSLDGAAWAPALARHTGGNPLFLLQTLSAGLEASGPMRFDARPQAGHALPLPPRVGRLIEQRFALLGGEAMRLVRLAAVAGQQFDADLAAQVLHVSVVDLAPAWFELEAAQLLSEAGFPHDLIAEAALRQLPTAIRQALHAQVAEALQARPVAATVLADHWLAARRWREAADALRRGADDARRLSNRGEEARCLELALDCLAHLKPPPGSELHPIGDDAEAAPADDDAISSPWQREVFETRWLHWLAVQSIEPFGVLAQRCDALLATACGTSQQARAWLARAMLETANLRDQPALDAAQQGGSLASQAGDSEVELACTRQAVRALSRLNRSDEAKALVARHAPALLQAPGAGSAPALIDFAAALIVGDDSQRAVDLAEAALRQATARQDWAAVHDAHVHLAWARFMLEQLVVSTGHYEQARRLHARLGMKVMPHQHGMGLARQYRALGRFGDAIALLEETIAAHGQEPGYTLTTLSRCELAIVYWNLGQNARAVRLLQEAPPADAAPSIRAAWLLTRARVTGLPREASAALVRDAQQVIEAEGMQGYRVVLRSELAIVLPPEEGLPIAREVLREARSVKAYVYQLRPALQRTCDLLLQLGRGEEALPLATELAELTSAAQSTSVSVPVVWWTVSQVYAAAGRSQEAAEAWRRARDWIMDTALPNVPEPFRHSYLHVNAVNRAILTARVAESA